MLSLKLSTKCVDMYSGQPLKMHAMRNCCTGIKGTGCEGIVLGSVGMHVHDQSVNG